MVWFFIVDVIAAASRGIGSLIMNTTTAVLNGKYKSIEVSTFTDAQEVIGDAEDENEATINAVEKARKEESEARAHVEQYASEGAIVPYTPGTLTCEELAVHSEFVVDEEEESKGGYHHN